jgi:hypothetical protein
VRHYALLAHFWHARSNKALTARPHRHSKDHKHIHHSGASLFITAGSERSANTMLLFSAEQKAAYLKCTHSRPCSMKSPTRSAHLPAETSKQTHLLICQASMGGDHIPRDTPRMVHTLPKHWPVRPQLEPLTHSRALLSRVERRFVVCTSYSLTSLSRLIDYAVYSATLASQKERFHCMQHAFANANG